MLHTPINDRRGISLIELLVALAIMTILVGFATMSSSTGDETLQASSLAKIIRDQILQSGSQARALGQPVGIAFPGAGTFGAQGSYQVIGTQRMRVVKPRDYSQEFATAYVVWAPVGGETNQDRLAADSYDLSTMTGLISGDPVILCLPNGEILVRGLPFDGTHYHLRVGSQPTGSAGGLTGLSHAWDIKFDEGGAASLARDTTMGPGSGASIPIASLPAPSANPTAVPIVRSLKTFPELVDKPSGLVLATLDQPVNLIAEAQSPNDLPLQMRWTTDGGQFSDASEWLPMAYSKDDDLWKGSILWSLPPIPSATQTVSVEVRDEFGNSSLSTPVSQLTFDTNQAFPWEVFFVSRTNFSLVSSIERMNGDGSGRVKLIEDLVRPPQILVSPSGEFIAWKTGDFTVTRTIYVSSRDGELLHTVVFPRDIDGPLQWAPDSSRFIVNDYGANPTTIWEVSPSTGAISVLTTIPAETTLYSASPDFRYFAYRTATNRLDAVVYDRLNASETTVYNGAAGGYGPVDIQLSAQGNYCGFYDQTDPGHRTILAKTDGSGHLDLGWGGVAYISPDESTVVYTSNTSARGGTKSLVVANIDGSQRLVDTNLVDYSTLYTPDSKFIVKQVRSFADYRLQALNVQTGEVIDLCPDDGLNKIRIGVSKP